MKENQNDQREQKNLTGQQQNHGSQQNQGNRNREESSSSNIIMQTIWKVSIKLGLVNISVNLYRAAEQNNVNNDMSDNGKIRVQRVITNTGNDINWRSPAKAYMSDGNYINM